MPFIVGQEAAAQLPAADFNAGVTSGCAPLSVNFNDLSTSSPTNWNWDFGNGQLSTVKNPVVIFSQPGRYDVKLVVRNANGINGITKTGYIIVNPAPAVAFSVNATAGCAPSTSRFTDLSTVTNGIINGWSWNFGDGSPAVTTQHPTHVYTTAGVYAVTLTAMSNNGCQSTITKNALIQVVEGVTPDFINSFPVSCNAPFTVNFTNQSRGPGTLTYTWNFGNGSSTAANPPPHIYNAQGNYTVKLVARSSFGCRDSVEKLIPISSIATGFTAPANTCINTPVNFQNSSTPLSAAWDFGNGVSSTDISPSYAYPAFGVYSVKLVNTYAGCIDSITRTVRVRNNPTVSFNANQTISCDVPFNVTFNDLTPNAVTRVWDFGDGSPAVTTNNASAPHTYSVIGTYTVSLTVTDINGCQASLAKPAFINIAAPTASIANAPRGGCINFSFSPLANINAIDGVASYTWNFGDGFITGGATPTHIYTTQGTYDLTLDIVTNDGCTQHVAIPNAIRTGIPPTGVSFTATPSSTCIKKQVNFTAIAGNSDQLIWDFGDGSPPGSGLTANHVYTLPGQFSVTLTPYGNGCPASALTQIINVLPPMAQFRESVNCTTDEVSFINESVADPLAGPITYTWTFGDPAVPDQSVPSPVIDYPSLGTYSVRLIANNGGCSDTVSHDVILSSESANFTVSKATVCKDESFTLEAFNSVSANITSYEWTLGASASFIDGRSIVRAFNANGVYDISLRVTDVNGCRHDTLAPAFITVSGPTASFTPSQPVICGAAPVSFTDLSDAPKALVSWEWSFGDLSPVEIFNSGPFMHVYDASGIYQVSLTVKDTDGCAHTSSLSPVTISRPSAFFRKDTTMYCPGISVNFTDSSSGSALTYLWTFGDGHTSSNINSVNTYSGSDSDYTVKLTVTDNLGCQDSLSKTIQVKSPKPAFDLKDTSTICLPLVADFIFRGRDYQSFYWDPGDRSGITSVQDLQHVYGAYGVFMPKLYLVGYGGCLDSAQATITITDPNTARLDYTAPATCNQLNVNFNLQSIPKTSFTILFGDGDSTATGGPSFSHVYNSPGSYTPLLRLKDSTGCEATITTLVPINIIGAEPLFGIDKTDFCDSGAVTFTNYTLGNDPVISYNWDFGDNQGSTDFSPVHFYNSRGSYYPKMTVNTQRGCTDSFSDTVLVYASPVSANILNRDTICINTPIPFSGDLLYRDTSAVQYFWTFGDGETSILKDPVKIFRSSGSFAVRLDTRISYGCSYSVSMPLHVVPPPVVNPMADQVIAVGSGITLPATYAGNVVAFNWEPDKNLDCSDCPNPVASPRSNTTYKVTATDNFGCTATGEVTVMVICNDKNFFIPNTFSPNNDGVNDYFYPRGSGILRIQSLRIFNRWGETVFEKKNFSPNNALSGWDGTFKGKPAISDVYIYTIEVICENAQVIPFQGNIMLLR